MRLALAGAAAALLSLAACGTAAAPAHHHQAATQPVTQTKSPSVQPTGPFKVRFIYCGHFSPKQVNQFEDYSGLIYSYTNVGSMPASISVAVNFAKGSVVTGDNVSGSEPTIAPGQTAYGDTGAVGDGGNTLKFTTCQPTGYTVTDAQGNLGMTTYPLTGIIAAHP